MPHKIALLLLLLAAVLLFTACGEDDPSPGGDYFPMTVGDYWVYEETMPGNPTVTLRYEVTGTDQTVTDYFEGETKVLTNTFPGGSAEVREQFVADDGSRAVRVKHNIYDELGAWTKSRVYDPGFLRLDRSKRSKDDEWTETVTVHTCLEPPQTDTDPDCVFDLVEEVQYSFRIVEEHQEVTVPAGTFNCIVIERSVVYGTVGEIKVYYYAPGVGKVKEITEDVKEENLVEFSVAKPDEAI